MIRPIVKDVFFLHQKSEPAAEQDLSIGTDLQATRSAHRVHCAGRAAILIGRRKRVFLVTVG
ncbi:MAG: peptide deformylase, partial [Solobacterium sp.]|nr:peptide deformylase [Solobacterium sp.]